MGRQEAEARPDSEHAWGRAGAPGALGACAGDQEADRDVSREGLGRSPDPTAGEANVCPAVIQNSQQQQQQQESRESVSG